MAREKVIMCTLEKTSVSDYLVEGGNGNMMVVLYGSILMPYSSPRTDTFLVVLCGGYPRGLFYIKHSKNTNYNKFFIYYDYERNCRRDYCGKINVIGI